MDVGFNLRFLSKLISSSFLLLFASNYAEQHPAKCLALKSSLNLENTTILDVEYVLGRTTVNTPGACLGDKQHVSSPLCRVQFSTQTSPTSAIRAEAWLPDEWYGRFLGIGNAGLDGCILYNELNYGSSMHFATVGSNNGHDGYTGLPFLGNPEVLNDFAFRSIHAEAVIGKQIVETYYGKSHTKAYYLGCATGGRQGTLSALRYPEDFDGILAGSPATDFNRLLHWMGMAARAIGAPNAAEAPAPEFIPPSLWRVVAEEVLAQCDTLDGVHDGIITEPDGCDFRPEALACDGGRTERCLTPPQVEALHKIYAPLYDNGELVYPRFDPGSERGFGGIILFAGNFPYITQDWLKYAVLNVTDFDFTTYGLAEGRLMDAINPGGIATFDGDMSAFRDRGGKFLTYHGRADPTCFLREFPPETQSVCTPSLHKPLVRPRSTRSIASFSCLGWRHATAGCSARRTSLGNLGTRMRATRARITCCWRSWTGLRATWHLKALSAPRRIGRNASIVGIRCAVCGMGRGLDVKDECVWRSRVSIKGLESCVIFVRAAGFDHQSGTVRLMCCSINFRFRVLDEL